MGFHANNLSAGGTGGGDSRGRIFKYDTPFGPYSEFLGYLQVYIGMRLRALYLMPVDNSLEVGAKGGAVEDEVNVGGLGVGANALGSGREGAKKVRDARNKEGAKPLTHHLAEKGLFGGAVGEDLFGRKIRPEQIADDFVIPFAVHACFDILLGNIETVEVALPGFGVKRHGIDQNTIQIEQERTGMC